MGDENNAVASLTAQRRSTWAKVSIILKFNCNSKNF